MNGGVAVVSGYNFPIGEKRRDEEGRQSEQTEDSSHDAIRVADAIRGCEGEDYATGAVRPKPLAASQRYGHCSGGLSDDSNGEIGPRADTLAMPGSQDWPAGREQGVNC